MKHPKVPEWKLERYVLGELPESEMQMIQNELKTDSSLKERYNAIIESDKEIRDMLPPLRFEEAAVKEQQSSVLDVLSERIKEFFYIPNFQAVGALGALLIAFVLITVVTKENSLDPQNDGIRTKSSTNLRIYRNEKPESVRLDSGDVASEGDLLQIRYMAHKVTYGFIFSVDGNGLLTRHFPATGDMAEKVVQDKLTSLQESYQLDNAPYFEKFYFVTSNNSFSLNEIERSAELMIRKGSDSLRLPSGIWQTMFELKKE